MTSFWSKLQKPFAVMAPMADVTDPAWRALVAKQGRPAVTWTEFVSADGLWHLNKASTGVPQTQGAPAARPIPPFASDTPVSANPLMRDLAFTEAERPIVAQFFTAKPPMMAYAAKLAEELGFDGVDINMGCPDRAIEKQGAGAAMVKTPAAAQAVIRAAQEASSLPVSVKTRIGWNAESIDEWIPALLETKPTALTVHLRTRKELSLVPAHWEVMPRIVALRDQLAPETRVIGNGDVQSLDEAREKCAEYGCDGVMIGRGIFGNPWVFAGRASEDTPLPEKLAALVELAHAFEALRPAKNFAILKKHIKAFVTGFDGAAEFRATLMAAENASELEDICRASYN
ncbi:MAG: tRNA-dihydrouridine synthase [Patescibacteria group bacterium]|nr:tRNA-dihydrouridine synthase [Patescibacteria group bacterium]MDE1944534.1 tRNA-dihydrouridine synthase [Patescibacteria group bacterium]MDE1944930.1 tRNA-dihydrouridine synthase [Patescibacteria group bacterium]MDE2057451.1 tRNA-dihydrouridine synthase [Patescibacteria group bacterium]